MRLEWMTAPKVHLIHQSRASSQHHFILLCISKQTEMIFLSVVDALTYTHTHKMGHLLNCWWVWVLFCCYKYTCMCESLKKKWNHSMFLMSINTFKITRKFLFYINWISGRKCVIYNITQNVIENLLQSSNRRYWIFFLRISFGTG